ncbi:MAG: SdrD B-like domain-containing protein, partial [Phototrophicaceae bacterium]
NERITNNPADTAYTVTTDTNGYYLFDGLPEQDATYFALIPASNFDSTGDALYRFTKSAPSFTTPADINNNGVFVDGTQREAGGVVSNPIAVEVLNASNLPYDNAGDTGTTTGAWAPTLETELSADTNASTGTGPNRRGRFNESDNYSNLTVDFSFYPERMSLGNRVWRDLNNNARIDAATEDGISGVTVRLYANAGGTPGSLLATTTTDGDGYYIFDNLLPSSVSGYDYIVSIPSSNFTTTGALRNLWNSGTVAVGGGGDNQTDLDDNGRDTYYDATTYGFISQPINLAYRAEPAGNVPLDAAPEALSNNPAHGQPSVTFAAPSPSPYTTADDFIGRQLQRNDNSDLTIDFGFYRPSSIGNRVWFDDGRGGTAANIADGGDIELNDGVQNGSAVGTEGAAGIANVTLALYRDANSDSTFQLGTDLQAFYLDADASGSYTRGDVIQFATTAPGGYTPLISTTDTNGYYLFDGLPEQNATYFALIPASNFTSTGALYRHTKSAPSFTTTADLNNNGVFVTPASLEEGGVVSNPIAVVVLNATGDPLYVNTAVDGTAVDQWAPTLEAELSANTNALTGTGPNSRGRFNESDNYSNLTVDFSFYPERMSLGNRVWRDLNNNARIDAATEDGISGVTVRLYANAGGTPGSLLATTTTDGDGYYIFDNLLPSSVSGYDYIVSIPSSNFTTTGALRNLWNSGTVAVGGGGDNQTDLDDNGRDTYYDATTYGFISQPINLAYRAEPAGNVPLDAAPEALSNNPAHGQPSVTFAAPSPSPYTTADDFIGRQLQRNDNSDLTIDFGFYRPSSIGNRVWFDDGRGGTAANIADGGDIELNDGVQNGSAVGTEGAAGIANVTLALYRDANSDSTFQLGTDLQAFYLDADASGSYTRGDVIQFATTAPGGYTPLISTTDTNGYYLFDGLPEQNATYFALIPASNFTSTGALYRHTKSAPSFTTTADLNNNGVFVTPASLEEGGVVSNPIAVVVLNATGDPLYVNTAVDGTAVDQWAPTLEAELSANTNALTGTGPNSRGRFTETDNYSNLTVDFSFFPERMSIGNRVWRDYNNNAVFNTGEPGITGVTVNLYTLTGTVPDQASGAPFRTTTTDANGYYI